MEPKASTIIDISKRRANHFDPKSDVLLSDTKIQATDLYKSHGEICKIPMMLGIECSHAKTNRQLINSWQGPIACKGMQGGDGLLATTARGKCGKPVLILNFHCSSPKLAHIFLATRSLDVGDRAPCIFAPSDPGFARSFESTVGNLAGLRGFWI